MERAAGKDRHMSFGERANFAANDNQGGIKSNHEEDEERASKVPKKGAGAVQKATQGVKAGQGGARRKNPGMEATEKKLWSPGNGWYWIHFHSQIPRSSGYKEQVGRHMLQHLPKLLEQKNGTCKWLKEDSTWKFEGMGPEDDAACEKLRDCLINRQKMFAEKQLEKPQVSGKQGSLAGSGEKLPKKVPLTVWQTLRVFELAAEICPGMNIEGASEADGGELADAEKPRDLIASTGLPEGRGGGVQAMEIDGSDLNNKGPALADGHALSHQFASIGLPGERGGGVQAMGIDDASGPNRPGSDGECSMASTKETYAVGYMSVHDMQAIEEEFKKLDLLARQLKVVPPSFAPLLVRSEFMRMYPRAREYEESRSDWKTYILPIEDLVPVEDFVRYLAHNTMCQLETAWTEGGASNDPEANKTILYKLGNFMALAASDYEKKKKVYHEKKDTRAEEFKKSWFHEFWEEAYAEGMRIWHSHNKENPHSCRLWMLVFTDVVMRMSIKWDELQIKEPMLGSFESYFGFDAEDFRKYQINTAHPKAMPEVDRPLKYEEFLGKVINNSTTSHFVKVVGMLKYNSSFVIVRIDSAAEWEPLKNVLKSLTGKAGKKPMTRWIMRIVYDGTNKVWTSDRSSDSLIVLDGGEKGEHLWHKQDGWAPQDVYERYLKDLPVKKSPKRLMLEMVQQTFDGQLFVYGAAGPGCGAPGERQDAGGREPPAPRVGAGMGGDQMQGGGESEREGEVTGGWAAPEDFPLRLRLLDGPAEGISSPRLDAPSDAGVETCETGSSPAGETDDSNVCREPWNKPLTITGSQGRHEALFQPSKPLDALEFDSAFRPVQGRADEREAHAGFGEEWGDSGSADGTLPRGHSVRKDRWNLLERDEGAQTCSGRVRGLKLRTFSLQSPFFEVAILYRRDTEGANGNRLANMLYEFLRNASNEDADIDKLPRHCGGRWPEWAPRSYKPSAIKVFLYEECPRSPSEAREFGQLYPHAVASSIVLVVLVSFAPNGAFGRLFELKDMDHVDHFLVEIILAQVLLPCKETALQQILPVYSPALDKSRIEAYIKDLPDVPSEHSNKFAVDELRRMGFKFKDSSSEEDLLTRSIREIITDLFRDHTGELFNHKIQRPLDDTELVSVGKKEWQGGMHFQRSSQFQGDGDVYVDGQHLQQKIIQESSNKILKAVYKTVVDLMKQTPAEDHFWMGFPLGEVGDWLVKNNLAMYKYTCTVEGKTMRSLLAGTRNELRKLHVRASLRKDKKDEDWKDDAAWDSLREAVEKYQNEYGGYYRRSLSERLQMYEDPGQLTVHAVFENSGAEMGFSLTVIRWLVLSLSVMYLTFWCISVSEIYGLMIASSETADSVASEAIVPALNDSDINATTIPPVEDANEWDIYTVRGEMRWSKWLELFYPLVFSLFCFVSFCVSGPVLPQQHNQDLGPWLHRGRARRGFLIFQRGLIFYVAMFIARFILIVLNCDHHGLADSSQIGSGCIRVHTLLFGLCLLGITLLMEYLSSVFWTALFLYGFAGWASTAVVHSQPIYGVFSAVFLGMLVYFAWEARKARQKIRAYLATYKEGNEKTWRKVVNDSNMSQVQSEIKRISDEATRRLVSDERSEWGLFRRLKASLSKPARIHQKEHDLDALYEKGREINTPFQNMVAGIFSDIAKRSDFVAGPIKNEQRAIQKIIRRYKRDPSSLCDIVRCKVTCDDLAETKMCLQAILDRSQVASQEPMSKPVVRGKGGYPSPKASGSLSNSRVTGDPRAHSVMVGATVPTITSRTAGDVEEQTGTPQHESKIPCDERIFRVVRVKNLFADPPSHSLFDGLVAKAWALLTGRADVSPVETVRKGECEDVRMSGYRHLCIHVEVGYRIENNFGNSCAFVPVHEWENSSTSVSRHICEIQLRLKAIESMPDEDYEKYRNLVGK